MKKLSAKEANRLARNYPLSVCWNDEDQVPGLALSTQDAGIKKTLQHSGTFPKDKICYYARTDPRHRIVDSPRQFGPLCQRPQR